MKALRWLFSSRHYELKIVLATLGVLLVLPLISVAVLATSGLAVASNVLAQLNPITHIVSIFDPKGKKVAEIQATTVWPVQGVVTLEFGEPDPPFQKHHTGIDIANRHHQIGSPITPFMQGTVLATDPIGKTGCGKYVEVDHGSGITSLYCHMSEAIATKGQSVKPGDVIGLEGETGDATGPHVHFQIDVDGIPVNPRIFMINNPDPGP